ncbi:MAG: hypothetical protein APF81_14240 [Desulfosporosinus sp. BRH_c37]|nr:MAG: hypothetical protein APF81_14240 [Desulfosporosinus sp. BRH_c37]
MKFKKKTAMLVSFALGTLLVATTALADAANKSGYDQLKDALKVTAEQSSEKFESYTMDFSVELKDNGKTLGSSNATRKYDRSMSATENINSSSGNQNGTTFNSYSDKTSRITWQTSDPTYYVTEFTKERTEEPFPNPFKEESAGDIEKIADAVVGNLKDHVVVTENADGSKGLAGSLTEMQIPSLINAVASLQMKQQFNGSQDVMPHLSKDVYVKEVKGTAKVNKDGVMESILGTAVLHGKDDQGTVHDITVEVLAKLSGINSTTVNKPDLTGKKVVKNTAKNETSGLEISNPEKFIGKFSNNILIEKDNKFVKVGERFIDITQIDNKTAKGRYYEVYKPGFEEYAITQRDFKFDAQKPAEKNRSDFEIITESGSKGNIYFDEHGGKIQFNLNSSSMGGALYDSTFSPDLD